MPDDTRTAAGPAALPTASHTDDHHPAPAPAGDGPPGYDLLDEVGRGGMGVVHRARDRAVGRDVAVKLLLDRYPAGGPAARRFLGEATITGQLQHPGIPAVHQVGLTPAGRPYLAMKLVKGQTLADVLAGTPDRGRLVAVFEKVCEAVAYAHSRGVIHRDLKPANVMVGAFGEVQVMDWGLAKVLGAPAPDAADPEATTAPTEIHSLREESDHTLDGQALGTPAFMPPEQAIGAVAEVDARSDVFGLGAVLCMILTGHPPYRGETAASTRALAARADLSDATARLAGCGADPELVALCGRCLAADRSARPADAGAVAAAVAGLRQAADERARAAEVEAGRAAVRAAEERKRRRLLLAAGGAVVAVLAAGAGLAGWQAVRATRAEGRAKLDRDAAQEAEAVAVRRKEQTEEVSRFMQAVFAQGSARGQAKADRAVNLHLTVKEAMDHAVKTLDGRFAGSPEIEAAVRHTIGDTYRELGTYQEAEIQLRRALEMREAAFGPEHLETLSSVSSLAKTLIWKGNDKDAISLARRARDGYEKVSGPDHPNTIASVRQVAELVWMTEGMNAAKPYFQRVLDSQIKTLGPDHPDTLLDQFQVLDGYYNPAAPPLLRRVLAAREKMLGPDHPDTLDTLYSLACECYISDPAAAEEFYRRHLAGAERTYGPDHMMSRRALLTLGSFHVMHGRVAEAVTLLERAYRAGEVSNKNNLVANELIDAYVRAGRTTDAVRVYGEYSTALHSKIPPKDPTLAERLEDLGRTLLDLHRAVIDAEPVLRECLSIRERLAPAAWETAYVKLLLGEALRRKRKHAEAEGLLLTGYAALKADAKSVPPTTWANPEASLPQAADRLISLYRTLGKPDEVAKWRDERAKYPPERAPHPRLVR